MTCLVQPARPARAARSRTTRRSGRPRWPRSAALGVALAALASGCAATNVERAPALVAAAWPAPAQREGPEALPAAGGREKPGPPEAPGHPEAPGRTEAPSQTGSPGPTAPGPSGAPSGAEPGQGTSPAEAAPGGVGDSGATDANVWTLAAVLDRIAAANPTLERAQANLDEARAVRDAARASTWPELSLGLDFVTTDNPAQAFAVLLNQERLTLGPGFDPTPGATDNWRKEVRLDWALFAPGRREAKRAAAEGEEAARLAREAAERRLLNAGVQAWLGLRAARELEAVARESVAVVERRLEVTRTRHDAGAALAADVLRLEVRRAAARQEAAQATLAARQAESALNHLMGRAPDAPLALAEEEVEVGRDLPEDLDRLLAAAQAGRRDLLAAAHELARVGDERAASRASRYPTLGAFAAYDVDGPGPGLDFDLDSYALGVGLRIPFSAATGPAIRRAEARERASRAALAELAQSIAREVRDDSWALAAARERAALAETAVGAAEEAFRIVAAAQDAGGATVTDVLEAENARRKARVRAVAARAAVEIARARLVAATGGVR